MPEVTLYAKGKPWAFGGIMVKAQSLVTDWVCLDPAMVQAKDLREMDQRLTDMLENGASYPIADAFGRDGMFDKDDIFLVFEKDDLLKLREYIDMALSV